MSNTESDCAAEGLRDSWPVRVLRLLLGKHQHRWTQWAPMEHDALIYQYHKRRCIRCGALQCHRGTVLL